MDPEELLAMGGVRVQGPNGPIITTPSQAARHGLQPLAPEPAQSPGMFAGMSTPNMTGPVDTAPAQQAPEVPGIVQSQTTPVAPGQIETVSGFTMGTSGRDGAPVNLGPSAAIASQNDAATAQARETFQAAPAQQAPGTDYQQLAEATAGGDRRAHALLLQLQRNGDAEAGRALEDLQAYVDAGLMRAPGTGGRGGPRVTQTATTTFTGAGRAPTEGEAAELAAAGEDARVADAQYREGLARQNEAETRALVGEADALERAANDGEAFRQRQQRQAAVQQAEVSRREREIDSLLREVGETRVDPNAIFAEGHTRNRIAGGIAIALASFGDAFSGGTDGMQTVMGVINGAIDRDLAAQQANLANKRDSIQGKRNALADMRDRFGNESAAQAALQASMYADAARQVRSLQARAASDGQRAQLEQLLAQLDAQSAAARQQVVTQSLGVTETVQQSQRRSGGGGGRARSFTAGMRQQEQGDVTPGERTTLQDREQAAVRMNEEIQEAREFLSGTSRTGPLGSLFPGSSRESRMLQLRINSIVDKFALAALGAATPDQIESTGVRRGLTMDAYAEDLDEIFGRMERDAQDSIVRARLSVSPAAVQEAQRRAPQVRQRVMLQEGEGGDVLQSAGINGSRVTR